MHFCDGCVLTLFAYETTAWGLMCESALNRDTAEFCPNQLMIRVKLPRGRSPDRRRSGPRSGGKSVKQLNVLSRFAGGVPPRCRKTHTAIQQVGAPLSNISRRQWCRGGDLANITPCRTSPCSFDEFANSASVLRLTRPGRCTSAHRLEPTRRRYSHHRASRSRCASAKACGSTSRPRRS